MTNNASMSPVCALCRAPKPLRDSHIIPQFMYRKMFAEGQKAHVLSTDASDRPIKVPTGVYEKLLCGDCETQLSAWETYASQVLYGGIGMPVPRATPVGFLVPGLDYRQMKLFQMSLLWRAAVSRRHEFRHVNLSKGRRETLRRMLLAGDPGKPREFGCILSASPVMLESMEDLVQMPEFLRAEPERYHRFVIAGFFWVFPVRQFPRIAERMCAVVTKRGMMHVLIHERSKDTYAIQLAHELYYKGNFLHAKRPTAKPFGRPTF